MMLKLLFYFCEVVLTLGEKNFHLIPNFQQQDVAECVSQLN